MKSFQFSQFLTIETVVGVGIGCQVGARSQHGASGAKVLGLLRAARRADEAGPEGVRVDGADRLHARLQPDAGPARQEEAVAEGLVLRVEVDLLPEVHVREAGPRLELRLGPDVHVPLGLVVVGPPLRDVGVLEGRGVAELDKVGPHLDEDVGRDQVVLGVEVVAAKEEVGLVRDPEEVSAGGLLLVRSLVVEDGGVLAGGLQLHRLDVGCAEDGIRHHLHHLVLEVGRDVLVAEVVLARHVGHDLVLLDDVVEGDDLDEGGAVVAPVAVDVFEGGGGLGGVLDQGGSILLPGPCDNEFKQISGQVV